MQPLAYLFVLRVFFCDLDELQVRFGGVRGVGEREAERVRGKRRGSRAERREKVGSRADGWESGRQRGRGREMQ